MPPKRLPAPPHRKAEGDDIDARIARAERDLVERQQRMLAGVRALQRRAREVTRPRQWLKPIGGALLAGAALVWLSRHGLPARPRGARAPASPSEATQPARSTSLPWAAHLIAFAWPLLPARWRARVSPGAARTLLSIGWPLVERLSARRMHAPLATVAGVDLSRCAGTWYEIAGLRAPFEARCTSQPRWDCTLRGGRLDVRRLCTAADGREQTAHGVARAIAGSAGAKLEVSFMPPELRWLPWAWRDAWVLQLDDDDRVALVGSPARDSLRVLARAPQLPEAALQKLLAQARAHGFASDRVTRWP